MITNQALLHPTEKLLLLKVHSMLSLITEPGWRARLWFWGIIILVMVLAWETSLIFLRVDSQFILPNQFFSCSGLNVPPCE